MTRLIFMGTPEFARIILEHLTNSGSYDIVGVYAQPDKPAGRGNKLSAPPVAVFAKEKGFPLFQPPKIRDPEVLRELKSANADFIVVAAYGKILPDEVMKSAVRECLNVHASLLPKYRGAAPINYAVLNGEKEIGIAIMRVVPELDAGPVFLERAIPISDEDDAAGLTIKLAHLGAKAIDETMRSVLNEGPAPIEQDQTFVSYAPKLDKALAPVEWDREARAIFNHIRALVPWPVAETSLRGERVKIFAAKPLTEIARAAPGTVVHIGKEGWTVATKDHNILITEVQVPGKKRMRAFDAANGLRLEVGTVLNSK
jgi:methionyl-tRNA formyltransferase